MLHMASGLRDWEVDVTEMVEGDMTKEMVLERMQNAELAFDPGFGMEYSNLNYYLLSCILEDVTGQSYEEYVTEHFLIPCNMSDSSVGETGNLDTKPSGQNEYLRASWGKGAGDLHSSVYDLLLWDRCLMNGQVLDQSNLEYMMLPKYSIQGGVGYGCGMMTQGNNVVFHLGQTAGYSGANVIFTTNSGKRVYFILLSNDTNTDDEFGTLVNKLADYFEVKLN